MFSFSSSASGAQFARGLAWRNIALLSLTFGWPFLLAAIVDVSGCRGVGGACGAVAFVATIYLKPLVFIAFMLSLLPLTTCRLRDARLSYALVLPLGLILLVTIGFWIIASVPMSIGFWLGSIGQGVPGTVPASFACLLALSFVRAGATLPRPVIALLAVICVNLLLTVLPMLLIWLLPISVTMALLGSAMKLAPALMPWGVLDRLLIDTLPVVMVGFCYLEWQRDSKRSQPSGPGWLLAAAGVIVIVAAGVILVADVILAFNSGGALGVLAAASRPGAANAPGVGTMLQVLQVQNGFRIAQVLILMLAPVVVAVFLNGSAAPEGAPTHGQGPALGKPGGPAPGPGRRRAGTIQPQRPAGFGRRGQPA